MSKHKPMQIFSWFEILSGYNRLAFQGNKEKIGNVDNTQSSSIKVHPFLWGTIPKILRSDTIANEEAYTTYKRAEEW